MFLVTGGTGFIGSCVARRLVEKGQYVVVYDLYPDLEAIKDFADKIALIRGDIRDTVKLASTIKEHNIETIIHLASLLPHASKANPTEAIRVNCEGTNNIFGLARVMDVKRVVWASSGGVYGPSSYYAKQPVNEDAPLNPLDLYAACKAFNEYMSLHYYTTHGLDIVGLRPFWVYGAGRKRGTRVNDLISKPATGKPAKLARSWFNSKIDWVYVVDVADAFVTACFAEKLKYRIFCVSSGEQHTIGEAVDYVRELIPDAVYEEVEATELPSFPLIDTSRMRNELGFNPSYSLKEGIRDEIRRIRGGY